MPAPSNIEARAARDRVIDLLGLGETFPLQDVAVRSEDKVGYGQRAPFEIQPGQVSVRYELFVEGRDGSLAGPTGAADGTGGLTTIHSAPVAVDTVFRIRASRVGAGPGVAPAAWLHGKMPVKVGVDARRSAWIHGVPRLHPDLAAPPVTDPWITDHGTSVEVRIERAQAGVRYELEVPGALGAAAPAVTGAGVDLALITPPVLEDTVIRIRATGPPSPGDPPEGVPELLDARLPLAVRADPRAAVAVHGSAVVDPVAPTAVAIAGSQASVVYRAFVRALRDGDFPRTAPAGEGVLTVAVPASPDAEAHQVLVYAPPRPDPWQAQADCSPRGEASAGNGETLRLSLGPIAEDSVIVIQARKEHFAGGLAGTLPVLSGVTELQLAGALAVLPRPEPVPGLTLTLAPGDEGQGDGVLVSGGQRGVFYHFRADAGGAEIGLPAYFHRLDETDPRQNRGIGHLEIGKDLAIARDGPPEPGVSAELLHPPDPVVDVAPLSGDTVSVTAVEARTGVGWAEARPVPVSRGR